jgi:Fe-S-cluster containining protein
MKKIKKVNAPRKRYPEDEAKYEWLPLLLNAYHIVDEGIRKELKKEEVKRKEKIACHKGCSNCCLRPAVPVTPLELLGISWYASKKLENPDREVVRQQLLNQSQSARCPFLVNDLCSIYPLRPLSCRIFIVFGAVCKRDEDPFITRFKGLWRPSEMVARESAFEMLPYYGITEETDMRRAFEEGFIANVAKPMHELDMSMFCMSMDVIDKMHLSYR